MANKTLVKGYIAGGVIAAYRIVKHGTSDTAAVQAAAATDSMIGVSELGATASGNSVSVVVEGIARVEYGGNVTRGALLTSDANGKAVAAAPAAGVNNRVIGVAHVSGVSGDIGEVHISPASFQGAA